MCGIAGFAGFGRSLYILEGSKERLARMTASLAARGPDAQGQALYDNCFLGHRRLAVIDAQGGAQPMARTRNGRTCTIVYNGELYNTPQLRAELIALGYQHEGYSDTETLLLAYMAWGEACLSRLNGIFAFAIFDSAAQSLFLARDRFGVKPLFYSLQNGLFLFGSELKALLASGLVPPIVAREGLCQLLGLFPSRTPGSGVYENVFELPPAHAAIFTREGFRKFPYWQLQALPHTHSAAETEERVYHLVTDAVTRQLVSDVPLCTFLSGGLDSSIITGIAAAKYLAEGNQLHTYSFDHKGNDQHFRKSSFQPDADAPFALLMSEAFQTHHHIYWADGAEKLAAHLEEAAAVRDLPGMGDIDASLLLFCKEIKKNFTVALSGECADEIFGGYPWFHTGAAFTQARFPWIRPDNERDAVLNPGLSSQIDVAGYVRARYEESIAAAPFLQEDGAEQRRRREIQYLNFTWFMANLLERKDRMSMGAGLEVRVPFADHRIVEYAYNIPWDIMAPGGREKGILRAAFARLLPREIIERKKSPYPKTHNPAYEKAVRELLLARLHDSPLRPLLNMPRLFTLMATPGNTAIPWFGQLMARPQLYAYLLQTDAWLRANKVELRV